MRPKKYPDGFMHSSVLVHHELNIKFEDYCARMHLNKTDVIESAMNICITPQERREGQLLQAKLQLEAKDRELVQLREENGRLTEQLHALRQRAVCQVRSPRADDILQDLRKLAGKVGPRALAIRCDALRPFLHDRVIPDDQKQEIVAFIKQVRATGLEESMRQSGVNI